jgi:spermidine/putrescine transport system substrate-binding protein
VSLDHPVDRRTLVLRLLQLGLGWPAIVAILSACRKTSNRPDDSASLPDTLEPELRIYNWSDYIGENTIADFERESGVRVVYDTYESNEDLIAKLQAGASGYDLVVPSGYAVRVLRALDLIEPIVRSALNNWGNLNPTFTNPSFDPDNRYTVPWQWGSAGLAVRTDRVGDRPDSWGVFHDPRYRGKMTQLDDMRDVIGCWLKFRGHSLNSSDPAALDQAQRDALAAKPNLKSYVSAPVKSQLIAGDVWIAHLWNGDTAQARASNSAIEFVLPKEGSMIYLDSLCIARGARHRRAAHLFMDYVLRPDVGAGISRRTGYGSPNAAALALEKGLLPPPTVEEMARLEYQEDLGAATQLWDRIWTEIKAG